MYQAKLFDTKQPERKLPEEVVRLLQEELDPTLLSSAVLPDSTEEVEYLEGSVVVDQANRIFGYGAWSFQILAGPNREELYTLDPQTGERKYLGCFYWTAGRFTLLETGAVQEGVGFIIPTEDTLEGHAAAFTGSVTQALKRCASRHGAQFGNGLRNNHLILIGEKPQKEMAPPEQDAEVPLSEQKAPPEQSAEAPLSEQEAPPEASTNGKVAQLQQKAVEIAYSLGWDQSRLEGWIREQTGKSPEELEIAEWAQKVLNPLLKLKGARK